MDAYLSPEMKSTGEAIGYDRKLHRAVYKAMIASGMTLRNYGTILVSVADEDKIETIPLVRRFYEMGFNIEATTLTAEYLKEAGIRTRVLHKPSEHSEEMLDSIRAGYVSYVINSSTRARSCPGCTTATVSHSAASQRRTTSSCSLHWTPCECCWTCLRK